MDKLDSFDALGKLFNVEKSETQEQCTANSEDFNIKNLPLRVWLKRLKGNKLVSSIEGFEDHTGLQILAKKLKLHCGTGGSVKELTIVIQGNHREKIVAFLNQHGAKAKSAGS